MNQRERYAPAPGSTERSPGSILTRALLIASVALTFGALGGTALADAPAKPDRTAERTSTDGAGELRTSRVELVDGSRVESAPRATASPRDALASFDAEPRAAKVAAVSVATAEPRRARSVESPRTSRTSEPARSATSVEPEPLSTTTTASVEAEPTIAAELEPTSGHVVNQCNPPEFPGDTAGWEITCEVTIVNTITEEGDTSSTVTTRTCLAAEGVLPPAGCTAPVTTTSGELVTSVDQCNGVATGGGSNVTCDVTVVNNVPEGTATTPITVNQCIGSGEGGVSPVGDPLNCSGPPDQNTTNADVTQCNGSANGGGAPGRVECSVVGEESAVPLTIDQCNGSANNGGSTVDCSVTVTNNFVAPEGPVDDGPVDDGTGNDGPGDDGPVDDGTGNDGTGNDGPGDDGPVVDGPDVDRPGSGASHGDTPTAVTPAAFVPASSSQALRPLRMSEGDGAQVLASGSESSTLPATGAGIGSMAAMGLMTMLLGGLLHLSSRSAVRFTTKR